LRETFVEAFCRVSRRWPTACWQEIASFAYLVWKTRSRSFASYPWKL